MKFYINPLSAIGQCSLDDQLAQQLKFIIDCWEYSLAGLGSGKITFFYDERIETTGLTDKGLTESVQKLQKRGRHGDLVRKWFIYTKNKVKRLGFESNQYIIANYNVDKLEGEVHPNGLAQENIWLSFAEGPVVFNYDHFDITYGNKTFLKENVKNFETFKKMLPSYEASPKHKKIGFHDDRGEWVSPMPLEDATAQKLLLQASILSNGDRLARDTASGKFYRFKKTHVDRNIFHGFQVEDRDIDLSIRNKL